jgi:hypothetical protein
LPACWAVARIAWLPEFPRPELSDFSKTRAGNPRNIRNSVTVTTVAEFS